MPQRSRRTRRKPTRREPTSMVLARRQKRHAAIVPVQPEPAIMADWRGSAATLVGASHLRHAPPIPCQDAAGFGIGNKPILLVADGAGSAKRSHYGAQAVVEGIKRLIATLGNDYANLLDPVSPPDPAQVRKMVLLPVKHALGILQDLARREDHPVSHYRSTLILAIGGRSRWLWLRIGDGALVVQRHGQLETIGESGKGEFANHTHFVDETLHPDQVQYGVLDSAGLSGIAAMSDGAAERLVHLGSGQVSGQMASFMAQARSGELTPLVLHRFFADEEVWRRTTGDDRALAVLACQEQMLALL